MLPKDITPRISLEIDTNAGRKSRKGARTGNDSQCGTHLRAFLTMQVTWSWFPKLGDWVQYQETAGTLSMCDGELGSCSYRPR